MLTIIALASAAGTAQSHLRTEIASLRSASRRRPALPRMLRAFAALTALALVAAQGTHLNTCSAWGLPFGWGWRLQDSAPHAHVAGHVRRLAGG